MQNAVTIHRGIYFPHMREFARQKCLLAFRVLPTLHSQATEPTVAQNMSNDAVLHKHVLFGVRKQKFYIKTPLSPPPKKKLFWARV